jgi:guanylate kinase
VTAPRSGLLIVISGPSGVGKDTIIRRLLELDRNLQYSISYTTRRPRKGEDDGVNYHFVDRNRFEQLVREGVFLEHATYDGNYYGTPIAEVARARDAGRDVLLKIEVQGAEQVRQRAKDALLIFVAPPSMEELVERQTLRGSESVEDIAARMKIAEREMDYAKNYDHVVVNDDVERAVAEILEIIRNARERHTK